MTHDDIWQVRFRQATRRVQELEEEIARLKVSAPTLSAADLTHKPPTWTVAEWNVGKWLSAALEDESVCGEMKHDVRAWFDELNACLVQPRTAEPKGLTDEQANEFADWMRFADTKGLEGRLELVRAIERALLLKGE